MRRLLAVLLTLAAVPAVAGCGGDDVKDLGTVDVAKAAQLTAEKKTARMTMQMRMSGMGLPMPVEMNANGVMDLTEARGVIKIDLAQILESLGAPAGTLGKDPGLELRFDGGDFYAGLPDNDKITKFSDGKRWIKADLVAIAKQLGFDVEGLGAAMNPSPAAQLRAFESLKGFKEIGKEEVDGVETRHFRGSFTLREFIRALPAAQRDAAEKAMERLDQLLKDDGLDQKQQHEIWIDEDGIARQWRVQSPLPAPPGMAEGQMTMSFKLSDFGVDVDVDAPDASETFELRPDMLSGLLAKGLTS